LVEDHFGGKPNGRASREGSGKSLRVSKDAFLRPREGHKFEDRGTEGLEKRKGMW